MNRLHRISIVVSIVLAVLILTSVSANAWLWDSTVTVKVEASMGPGITLYACTSATLRAGDRTYGGIVTKNPLLDKCTATFANVPVNTTGWATVNGINRWKGNAPISGSSSGPITAPWWGNTVSLPKITLR